MIHEDISMVEQARGKDVESSISFASQWDKILDLTLDENEDELSTDEDYGDFEAPGVGRIVSSNKEYSDFEAPGIEEQVSNNENDGNSEATESNRHEGGLSDGNEVQVQHWSKRCLESPKEIKSKRMRRQSWPEDDDDNFYV